ncbi:hypothetical protein C4D60_Mb03t21880 [Musa balbisiana]|uniref:Uncharacterized protein n=1 Tax=Musa balbisiana TaxID=52838 RepID=A0A4S8JBK9_MUSBA|nr:hypothetical protein C4D60_Mb03t21880 [Musa balbisiana]
MRRKFLDLNLTAGERSPRPSHTSDPCFFDPLLCIPSSPSCNINPFILSQRREESDPKTYHRELNSRLSVPSFPAPNLDVGQGRPLFATATTTTTTTGGQRPTITASDFVQVHRVYFPVSRMTGKERY